MEKVAIAPARVIRIIWFGFVLAGVTIIFGAMTVPVQTTNALDPTAEMAIAIVALSDVALAFFARRFLARLARVAPGSSVESAEMNRWFLGNVASLAIIFSCNLLAFVLHMLRARGELVELLFGAGMISLLLWRPGTPPEADGAETISRG